MKKLIAMVLVSVMVIGGSVYGYTGGEYVTKLNNVIMNKVKINVNGKDIKSNSKNSSIILYDEIYCPFAPLMEGLGLKADYDAKTKTMKVQKPQGVKFAQCTQIKEKLFIFKVNNEYISVNGKQSDFTLNKLYVVTNKFVIDNKGNEHNKNKG